MKALRLSLKDRYAGSLAGLASGDAVGTTVEFRSRGTFAPVTDMIGGGPFDLAPGQWTDAESSRTTHDAPEAVECCKLLGFVLSRCLAGLPKNEVLNATCLALREPNVANLAAARYTEKTQKLICGTGYAVASLEAALWCFSSTSTFEAAVLAAANLGDDADTTAAIVGQVAGAFYGLRGIPKHWLNRLHLRDEILSTAEALYAAAVAR